MPKGRASIRTLLGLRTWARRHFLRFNRSAKVCTWGRKQSHALERGSQAAALPKSSSLLEWVPGCKGAHSLFSLNSVLCYTGSGCGKRNSITVKVLRSPKNYHLNRSPQTYPVIPFFLETAKYAIMSSKRKNLIKYFAQNPGNPAL